MIGIMILMEVVFALGFLVLPVVWLILIIAKKNRKHIGKAIIICFIGFIINGIAIGELSETKEEKNVVAPVEETQTPVLDEQPTTTPTPAATPEPIKEPGSSRSNPIVVTVSQLANEINSNTDAAKEKYNDKYVQITGEITQVVDGGSMMGYYLYGQRGGSGLRIVCWKNGDIESVGMRGKTRTFLGKMREVSTVNTTDIGDCEIVE